MTKVAGMGATQRSRAQPAAAHAATASARARALGAPRAGHPRDHCGGVRVQGMAAGGDRRRKAFAVGVGSRWGGRRDYRGVEAQGPLSKITWMHWGPGAR